MTVIPRPADVATRATPALPGLAVVSVATLGATAVSWLAPSLNASTIAVVLGAVAVNAQLVAPGLRPGLDVAAKSLLRLAVVLLGLQLSLPELRQIGGAGLGVVAVTVAVTFLGTQLAARLLGLRRPLGLLVATGFSICGASAVAAMRPVAGGDDDDTAVSVALVTLCGSLAIVVLPLLRTPLGLDHHAFGSWTGASVHDIGQTVATANRVGPGALEPAVIVKLTRVVLLAPLVAVVGAVHRREPGCPRTAPVPPFVLAFLVAIAVRSTGLLPSPVLDGAHDVQQLLLTAALFALGTGISWPLLRRAGGRPLVLGAVAWVLVAVVAYAGVRLTAA